jgi:anaerobic ribonucleoside-triphosphate reductase activating protein
MKIYNTDIVLQEVPDEISLSITVSGCRKMCDGCHSPFLWTETNGNNFTLRELEELLEKYKNYISCVVFMGGEWFMDELIVMLKKIKEGGLKTCLYTGEEEIDDKIKENLDFLKTGRWINELGGLNSPTTNQKFTNIKTKQILNKKFQK